MTAKKANVRVTHQVWWEDLLPWLETLHGEHGVLVNISVSIPPPQTGVVPAVVVEAWQARGSAPRVLVYRNWKPINIRNTGSAEAAALQLVTQAHLALDEQQAQAEAKQSPLGL